MFWKTLRLEPTPVKCKHPCLDSYSKISLHSDTFAFRLRGEYCTGKVCPQHYINLVLGTTAQRLGLYNCIYRKETVQLFLFNGIQDVEVLCAHGVAFEIGACAFTLFLNVYILPKTYEHLGFT